MTERWTGELEIGEYYVELLLLRKWVLCLVDRVLEKHPGYLIGTK